MKRLTSLILVLVMVCSMLPTAVFAEETVLPVQEESVLPQETPTETPTEPDGAGEEPAETPSEVPVEDLFPDVESTPVLNTDSEVWLSGYCGGEGDGTNLAYVLTSDGVLTITGSGAMREYNHYGSNPAPWDDYIYREGEKAIRKVILPDGLTTIGHSAFFHLDAMMDIDIPDTVTSIGEDAFYNCRSMMSLVIPESVTQIGESAFSWCYNLRSIDLRGQVTELPYCAFNTVSDLTELHLPGTLKTVGESALSSCSAKTTIYFDGYEYQWNAITFGADNDGVKEATVQIAMDCEEHAWVDATCTAAGYCSNCGKISGYALGHRKVVTQAAVTRTCTKDGCTEGSYCSRCNEVLSEYQFLPKFGSHSFTRSYPYYEVVSEASATVPGQTDYTCWRCGLVESVYSCYSEDIAINGNYFPDSTFRNYIRENFDEDGDGYLSYSERDAVDYISAPYGTQSVSGVFVFHDLYNLNCGYLNLTELDVRGCKSLRTLYCQYNQLTELDLSPWYLGEYGFYDNLLSGCPELNMLDCNGNNLSWLNVNGCQLYDLDCSGNALDELDLSNCADLSSLDCSDNDLTALDVSGFTSLSRLYCDGNYNMTELDASGCTQLWELRCDGAEKLDVSGCTSLQELECSYSYLTELDVTGCTGLTALDCSDGKLTELDVSSCTSLQDLDCSSNDLTELDVSACRNLSVLNCSGNALTSLDVSGCTGLQSLGCSDNDLTELDLTACPGLTGLNCGGNPLEELDLSILPNLTSLSCDSCGLTELDLSPCISLTALNCSGNELTELDLSPCTGLIELNCDGNQLDELDASTCTSLETLYCRSGTLTELDVSGCTSLTRLDCYENALTELDVSSCANLATLFCYANDLTELNVGGCTSLTRLDCYENALTELDVSSCANLVTLSCYANDLTELNASGLAKLRGLYCYSNNLAELNVSGCTGLVLLNCKDNRLLSLDLSDCTLNTNGSNTSISPQTAALCLEGDVIDLAALDPAIDMNCVSDLTGGTLDGSKITVTDPAQPVTYKYTTTDAAGVQRVMAVTLNFDGEHTFDEGTVRQEPTCTLEGVRRFTCTSCGYAVEEHVEKLPHTPVTDVAVVPDCTDTGLTEGSHCDVCGAVLTAQETVPALGHTPVTDAAVAPDCTNTGLAEGSHCDVCGEVLTAQETVPALGHTPVVDAGVEPDCTNTGLTEGSHCEVCGAVLTAREVIDAIGHTPVTDAGYAATCTAEGLSDGSHCDVCGEVLTAQETVPALGHTPVTDAAVAPDCTNTGLTEGSHCDVCGEVLTAQETVTALGHTPVTDAAVAPDCTNTGLTEGSHCDVCREVLTPQGTVQELGHTLVSVDGLLPTCTENGYTTSGYCQVCGVTLKEQQVIPATGHWWEEPGDFTRTCEECGITESFASVSGTCGDNLTWVLTTDGVLTVTGSGDMYDYGNLETPWDAYRASITEVLLPDGLTSIGNYAFARCKLTEVTVPPQVTDIGEYAFFKCSSLTSVTIPAAVVTVGEEAFECPDLSTVLYAGSPEQWSAISVADGNDPLLDANICYNGQMIFGGEYDGFNWTLDLETGKLTVTGAGELTVYDEDEEEVLAPWAVYSKQITRVELGEGITAVGAQAFYKYSALEAVILPATLKNIDDWAFYGCSVLSQITLPEGLEQIGDRAFYNCAGLTSLTIPAGVDMIGARAFVNCTSLSAITVARDNTEYCSVDGILFSKDMTALIQCPQGKFMGSYAVPGGVETIGTYAFYNSQALMEVTLPLSLALVETYAFYGCPIETVIYHGTEYLWGAVNVEPDSKNKNSPLLEAREYIFTNQSGVLSGTCGDNAYWTLDGTDGTLTITGYGPMNSNAPINIATRLILSGGIETIPSSYFADCPRLTSIEVSDPGDYFYSMDGALYYGNYLWRLPPAKGVTAFTVPESIRYVRVNAFRDCTELERVHFPASVTNVGNNSFYGCTGMREVTVDPGNTVMSSDGGALLQNGGLRYYPPMQTRTTFAVPGGTAELGYDQFPEVCEAITELYIPLSVAYIEEDLFTQLPNLEKIVFEGSEDVWEGVLEDLDGEAPVPVTFENKTTVSGSCGATAYWELDLESGEMRISGTGEIEPVGWEAFANKITAITLGSGISGIRYTDAFADHDVLKSFAVEAGNPVFEARSGVLYQKEEDGWLALLYYPRAKIGASFKVPDDVDSIEQYAFSGNTKLTTVSLPDSISYVNFEDCTKLEAVKLYSTGNPGSYKSDGNVLYRGTTLEYCPVAFEGDEDGCYTVLEGTTVIGYDAFLNNRYLSRITLTDGVVEIQQGAFEECRNLEILDLPASLMLIGDGVFPDNGSKYGYVDEVYYAGTETLWNCVAVGEGNERLYDATFHFGTVDTLAGSLGDNGYWSMDPTNGVLTVSGTGAVYAYNIWQNNPALKKLVVEEGVTSFYASSDTFSGSALNEVSLPASLTEGVSYFYFRGCTQLENIFVADDNPVYWDEDGVLMQHTEKATPVRSTSHYSLELSDDPMEEETLICYPAGRTAKSYTVPESVTVIGDHAFMDCAYLETLYFHDRVSLCDYSTSGIRWPIENCPALKAVYVEAGNPDCYDVDGVLYKRLDDTFSWLVHYPAGRTETSFTVPRNTVGFDFRASGLKTVYYPGTQEQWDCLNRYLYKGKVVCSGEEDLLSGAVTDSINWSFDASSSTLTISGSGAVPALEAGAYNRYKECLYRAKNLVIEEGITSVGDCALNGSMWLERITLPDSLESIGDLAFGYANALMELPSGVKTVSGSAFGFEKTAFTLSADNQNLKLVDGVLYSADGKTLVAYCRSGEETFVVPEGVTTIGRYAFFRAEDLEEILLPSTVTTVEDYAFAACWSLTALSLPSGVTSVGIGAIYECYALRSLAVNSRSAATEDYWFVTDIGTTDLESVTFAGTLAQWKAVGQRFDSYYPGVPVTCLAEESAIEAEWNSAHTVLSLSGSVDEAVYVMAAFYDYTGRMVLVKTFTAAEVAKGCAVFSSEVDLTDCTAKIMATDENYRPVSGKTDASSGGAYEAMDTYTGWLYATEYGYIDSFNGSGLADEGMLLFSDGESSMTIPAETAGLDTLDLGRRYEITYNKYTQRVYGVRETGCAVGTAILADVEAAVSYGTSSNQAARKYVFTIGALTEASFDTGKIPCLTFEGGVIPSAVEPAALYRMAGSNWADRYTAIDRDADGDIDYLLVQPVLYGYVEEVGTSKAYGDYVELLDNAGEEMTFLNDGNTGKWYLSDHLVLSGTVEEDNVLKLTWLPGENKYHAEVLPEVTAVLELCAPIRATYTFGGVEYTLSDGAWPLQAHLEEEYRVIHDGELLVYAEPVYVTDLDAILDRLVLLHAAYAESRTDYYIDVLYMDGTIDECLTYDEEEGVPYAELDPDAAERMYVFHEGGRGTVFWVTEIDLDELNVSPNLINGLQSVDGTLWAGNGDVYFGGMEVKSETKFFAEIDGEATVLCTEDLTAMEELEVQAHGQLLTHTDENGITTIVTGFLRWKNETDET